MEGQATVDDRLREALADGSFVLYRQPIVDLTTRRVSQHEVLLRLLENDGSHVDPEHFLPAAERLGVVGEIDRMVVDKAVAILEATDVGDTAALHMNISGSSLGDPDLLSLIESALDRSGVDPARLVIEVTETAAVDDIPAAIEFAESLRAVGCALALDDFGVGFGSLHYLKYLPLDFVKIDGEFVRDLTTNQRDRAIVEAIVVLAHGLGLKTIAEFVSDDETIEMLATLGVDYGQGYHLGEPVFEPGLATEI